MVHCLEGGDAPLRLHSLEVLAIQELKEELGIDGWHAGGLHRDLLASSFPKCSVEISVSQTSF